MMIKHRILKDFQYITDSKKILILKKGAIIEDYVYKTKLEEIPIDINIVDSNASYFNIIDWKDEILKILKSNKIPSPSTLCKKIFMVTEDYFKSSENLKANDNYSDIEREFKQKLKSLNDREVDLEKEYRIKLKSLSEKESDYEVKIQKVEKRELDIENEYNDISKRDSEIRKKLSELREKEELLRDLEFEIGKKERNMDKVFLESEKTIDDRQKEMNDKLEQKLKDLDKRESEYNEKMENLNIKEKDMYSNFDDKIKEYQDSYKEKMIELSRRESEIESINLSKIKEIERMIVGYYNDVPWHHNNMDIFKTRIQDIINEFKNI